MKMHEKLTVGAKEPRNRVQCRFRIGVQEDSSEPIQLWLGKGFADQGIFMTQEEAEDLMIGLKIALEDLK